MISMLKTAAIAGFVALFATVSVAQDAKQAIGARKSYMKLSSFYLGQLGAMAKGEVDYDAEKAAALALSLEHVSQLDQSAMWPQGTDNVAMPTETRAKPEIWSTWPKIAETGKAYGEAVAMLASAAGTDLAALQAAVGEVGKQCGACHDDFRGPRN